MIFNWTRRPGPDVITLEVSSSTFVWTIGYIPRAPTRLSQFATEAFLTTPAAGRLSQFVVEVFAPPIVAARLTQLPVELWDARTARTRVTQLAVELFLPPWSCPDAELPFDPTDGISCPKVTFPTD